MRLRRSLFACFAIIGGALAANAQDVTVKVGTVRSISTATILWGVEQGYFKDYGIKVVTESLDTAANSIALLAQNQLQLVEGGISAGYFNALEKNLPVTMVLDRVSSPLGHNLMLRPDLKGQITQLRQLKGKTIATNGQGAVSTYEVGKLLESDGLTINDVDIKVIPFTQYAVAFNNKAIDAAITIPPFTAQLLDGGHAVNFKDPDDIVKPHPLTTAVSMINTDFAPIRSSCAIITSRICAPSATIARPITAAQSGRLSSSWRSAAAPKRARNCCTSIRGRHAAPTARSMSRACSTCRPGSTRAR
jgi:ABC-type nitrate/sulfonate/bicarbonate transport system substrate-binding protein